MMLAGDKFTVDVIWHFQSVVNVVKQFHHDELEAVVQRAVSFAKISARQNAVGSPELFGVYTVEAGEPATVYYHSGVDRDILELQKTHNRSKV